MLFTPPTYVTKYSAIYILPTKLAVKKANKLAYAVL